MIQTKYITPDEFKEYTGIDLKYLQDDANPSNKEQVFLKRIEDRMAILIDVDCFQKIDFVYPSFSDYQKDCYKHALVEQALYIFRSGEQGVDSPIDPEKGLVVAPGVIESSLLAPFAKKYLIACGVWTKVLRFGDFGPINGGGGLLGGWI